MPGLVDLGIVDSGDIMLLVCLVIWQDYLAKGRVTLWQGAPEGESPPYQVWWP